MIYTHVLKLGGGAVKSPLDLLRLGAAKEQGAEPRAREPDLRYTVFAPCFRATPSSTARATSAS
jgi:hypothetical protein